MTPQLEISAQEVATRIAAGAEVQLLDCREPEERRAAHLPSSLFIPMGEIAARLAELVPYKHVELIVYCHLGSRSLMVAEFLRAQGFTHAQSMTGGIEAWVAQIDAAPGQSN